MKPSLLLFAGLLSLACAPAEGDNVPNPIPAVFAPSARPAPPRGIPTMDPETWARLLKLRESNDVLPWLQPIRQLSGNSTSRGGVEFPPNSVAGDQKPGGVNLDFSMLVEDFAVAGVSIDTNAGRAFIFTLNRNFDLTEYDGQRPQPKPELIIDRLAFGTPTAGWQKYRGGLMLRQGVQHTVEVKSRDANDATVTSTLHGTYRGWRLVDKGSLPVQQKTWEEWAAEGVTFERHPLKVTIPGLPASPSTEAVSADLTFPAEWLVTGLYLDVADQSGLGQTRNMLFRVNPPQAAAIQGDWVSAPTVSVNTFRETAWRFPIPYHVSKDTLWRLEFKKNLDDGQGAGSATVVMVEGFRLVRPGQQ